MQISAANLLASQSQATVRPQGTAAAFEPIAFKQTPQPVQMAAAKPATAAQAPAASAITQPAAHTSSGSATGYVRPGTNIDIKI